MEHQRLLEHISSMATTKQNFEQAFPTLLFLFYYSTLIESGYQIWVHAFQVQRKNKLQYLCII